MKFLLAFSISESLFLLSTLILAGAVLLFLFYLWYQVITLRHQHISTKKLNIKSIFNLLLGRKRKSAKWTDFKEGEGKFADKSKMKSPYGGGVSGSW